MAVSGSAHVKYPYERHAEAAGRILTLTYVS